MPRRALALALCLLLTACKGLPLPRLVFDTPTPLATAGPPPTPLPTTIVTFRVRVPDATPANSAPAVSLLDLVSGTTTTVVLTQAGASVWTGGTSAPQGSVLFYRYARPLPSYVEEVAADGQPIPFRLLAVNSEKPTIEETVAGWADVAPAAETGAIEGRVWNANTGQGVSGLLVTAAGQVTLSAHDGGFRLYRLPAGPLRVTMLAPDGSLRPANATVTVAAGQVTPVDLISQDPNAVHVTFVVRPPSGADPNAVLRLVGDVWQLGGTFVPAPGGAALAIARAPLLVPLADGRWAATVELYEGTHLHYKYTLGDGAWNGELNSSGEPRLRQLIVPASDLLVEDAVTTWSQPRAASITFEALTPESTPANDLLSIQFRTDRWLPPLPMWRVGTNDWRFVLYNPSDFSGSVFYRYCRNLACGAADDTATAGPGASGRFVSATFLSQNLRDNINGWQWLGGQSSAGPSLPPVNAHLNFAAGAAFDETWQPNAAPFYSQGFNALRAEGANWVSVNRRLAAQVAPTPAFHDDPALAPLPADWHSLVSTAHTVGLQVALHPVTCHYTPYGACEYWNGLTYDAPFWNNWFAAYEYALISQAALARDSGADLLVIGDFKLRPSFPGEPEAPPDAEARWRGLINNVRAVFKGRLAFELLMGEAVWPNPPAFLDAVDVVRLWWWSPLTNTSAANPADLAAAAAALLDSHALPLAQRFGKPVQLSVAYLSADGAATQCLRRADGACHPFEAFLASAPDVSTYPLDLSEQADAYHALMLAVNDRPWIGGLLTYGYLPNVTLRDKSLSVRGKPAEAVLAAWWPGLTGH
jgi:hypothetical protein